ncbi:MAG: hypothetical protein WAZ77_11580 [Candidatus Nitrosopolaris sp.]
MKLDWSAKLVGTYIAGKMREGMHIKLQQQNSSNKWNIGATSNQVLNEYTFFVHKSMVHFGSAWKY